MQGVRFDSKPSQDGETDKKRRKKKLCSEQDLNPRIRLQILHLTARLKLESAITPVKFNGFFSKVNRVIYSSSPIS